MRELVEKSADQVAKEFQDKTFPLSEHAVARL